MGDRSTMDLKLSVIETITNDFSEDQKVGSGGYGDVYKAAYNGKLIAVKKLHPFQGLDDKQFHSELLNLTKVSHKNVVRLIGYCYETRYKYMKHNGETIWAKSMERVFCFEYMHGGSLETHITDESCDLDWPTCYNIIRGTCEGLNHLHSAQGNSIYHLDLKPSNILLDKSMMPKIADLGLSRIFASSKTHQTEVLKGTREYMPPEYINRSLISKKFDVFSFGVVIIKMVAGNTGYFRYYEMSPEDFVKLVSENWTKRLQEMPGLYSSHEIDILRVKTCAEIALRCVNEDQRKRPCIEDIVHELEKLETEIKIMSLTSNLSKDLTLQELPCWNELLWVEPAELFFPFQINKQMSCSLELHNESDAYMAFFIITYSDLQYVINPYKGVIQPQSRLSVRITLPAQEEKPEGMFAPDEFTIKSKKVNDGVTAEDITKEKFSKKTGNIVEKVKIDVVFDAQKKALCMVEEEPKEHLSLDPLEISGYQESGQTSFEAESSMRSICDLDKKYVHTLKRTGPWGGQADGMYLDVAVKPRRLQSITVRNERDIHSIAFTYLDEDGNKHNSGQWGWAPEGITQPTINLKPTEVVTEVSGTYVDTGVSSLKFVTNLQTYGPYGTEYGTPFNAPVPKENIVVGFISVSDRYLEKIGVYTIQSKEVCDLDKKNVPTLQRIGPWGGVRDCIDFDIAVKPRRLVSITVRNERDIHSIAFTYMDNDGKKHNSGQWGWAPEGVTQPTINLKPTEFVTEVSGTYVRTAMPSLKFVTNLQTYGPYGTVYGTPFKALVPKDNIVVGFFSVAGRYLEKIGVYTIDSKEAVTRACFTSFEAESSVRSICDLDKKYVHTLKRTGPWGGQADGMYLDVAVKPRRLQSITVRNERDIHSIAFTYLDEDGKKHNSGQWGWALEGITQPTINLKPTEVVTEVSGTYVDTGVSSLKFVTNLQTYGPYGTEYGTPFNAPVPKENIVVGFISVSNRYLEKIGVYTIQSKEVCDLDKKNVPTLQRIGPWGGVRDCIDFDIAVKPRRLVSITVRNERDIHSITFTYMDNDGKKHNSGQWGWAPEGVTQPTINLKPTEFVTEVSGTYVRTAMPSLKFVTNLQTYGPYGTVYGTPFKALVPKDNIVVGFFSVAGRYLEKIGVYTIDSKEV